MLAVDVRRLDRLMRLGQVIEFLRTYGIIFLLPFVLLQFVLGPVMLYAGAAYGWMIVFFAWGVVPRLGPMIRDLARALYAAGAITGERYNEAARLVNGMLSQGPPQPGDKPPMPLLRS